MDPSYIGAIDIGGTKMAALVADCERPLARVSQPTIKTGSVRAVGEQAVALLHAACDKAGIARGQVTSVGVASCGPFVRVDSMLGLAAPNICGARSNAADLPNDWDWIPLEQVLREQFDTVAIRNDCAAALVAERHFGAARGESDCVYVTWSTGIGFGLCVDGEILQGKHGNAGHAGHMLMDPASDAVCGCGNRGDIEALVSGRNLRNRQRRSTAEIFRLARSGDSWARPVVEEAAQWLGRALYNVAATLDTRLFVMGGSIWTNHGDWLAPLVLREISARLPALTADVRIAPAALGQLVADIGALLLVMPPGWLARWDDDKPWLKLSD